MSLHRYRLPLRVVLHDCTLSPVRRGTMRQCEHSAGSRDKQNKVNAGLLHNVKYLNSHAIDKQQVRINYANSPMIKGGGRDYPSQISDSTINVTSCSSIRFFPSTLSGFQMRNSSIAIFVTFAPKMTSVRCCGAAMMLLTMAACGAGSSDTPAETRVSSTLVTKTISGSILRSTPATVAPPAAQTSSGTTAPDTNMPVGVTSAPPKPANPIPATLVTAPTSPAIFAPAILTPVVLNPSIPLPPSPVSPATPSTPVKTLHASSALLSIGVSDEEFIGPFADWVNVKTAYGAVGNGIADDTTAIQNGLNALRKYNASIGPTVLYFPAGTYRVTQTLKMELNFGANLIGADPRTTSIVWGGAANGTMLVTSGSFDTLFTRLTWDGKNAAGIGIAQWWNFVTDRANYQGSIKHVDEVFQNMGIGIYGGRVGAAYGQGDSETMILRVSFLNESIAGVNLGSPNAVDWMIWDSKFTNCARGVTNYFSINDAGATAGAGQFSINRSVFQGSTVADVAIGNTSEWLSLKNNFSINSHQFFYGAEAGPNPVPIILQNNTIIDTLDPVAIEVGNEGPLILIDNKIRSTSGSTSPAIHMEGSGITAEQGDRDIYSIGNEYTVTNPISLAGTTGRVLTSGDTTVSAGSIAATLPNPPVLAPNYGRAIFEVPLNATADQIQATINSAASHGANAVVHLPAGNYSVNHTLIVPANAHIQIAGDSQATALWWNGSSPNGPVISLAGPSYATLRDLSIGGSTVTAIAMPGANQSGGRVFLSGSYMSAISVLGLTETRLDAQANTGIGTFSVDSSTSILAIGGCGVPLSLLGGSNVLISDCWSEGTRSNLFNLESGNLTFLGGLLAPYSDGYGAGLSKSAAAVEINDFTGDAAFIGVGLNLKTGSNGILVNSASAATQALFFGISTNATGFFTNDVAADTVGAVFSKDYMPGAGSYDIPDAGDSSSAFIAAGFSQARSVVWETTPMAHVPGATDVRLFRIGTPYTTLGLTVTN